jgi:hypothetical protein
LILTVIYLGNTLPRYVLKNLEYLRSTFDKSEVYFISDSVSSINKAAKIGVKTWLAPNPDEQWRDVREQLNHPMSFRQGFWFKTLARIFVLNSFMQLHKDESCLQIEADVFLFQDFPIAKVFSLDAEIAFPMESNEMGIASLLYLKDHKSAQSLTDFALGEIRLNPHITDMSLLGRIAHSKILKFIPLPTLPESLRAALSQPEAINLVCQNSLCDSGVFDGITIGQYLLGVDPRNSRGRLVLHRIQPSHAINPEKLTLTWDGDENLSLKALNGNSQIYNLHNHAKDLRLYKKKSRNKLLQKRISSSIKGETKEFKVQIFITVAFKAIRRRAKIALKRS